MDLAHLLVLGAIGLVLLPALREGGLAHLLVQKEGALMLEHQELIVVEDSAALKASADRSKRKKEQLFQTFSPILQRAIFWAQWWREQATRRSAVVIWLLLSVEAGASPATACKGT